MRSSRSRIGYAQPEHDKDCPHALRLYRRILLIAPDTDVAATARERILAIEADPTIENK